MSGLYCELNSCREKEQKLQILYCAFPIKISLVGRDLTRTGTAIEAISLLIISLYICTSEIFGLAKMKWKKIILMQCKSDRL